MIGLRWLQQLFSHATRNADLDDELSFHLEMEQARLERAGHSPEEARRRAHVAFGGYAAIVEETRSARRYAWVENAWRDMRLGLRGVRRNRGFTAVAVLTLSIGIGATTAVFSLANALLIQPVPGVRAQDELVVVQLSADNGFAPGISHANIVDLRAGVPALSGLAGHAERTMQGRAADGAPFEVDAEIVQGDYFGVLGLQPLRGRWFTAQEAAPDAAGDVVIISERFWRSHLGSTPDIIGATIQLNAETYRIAGIAPRGFHGTDRTSGTDVWLPPAAYGRMWHRPIDASDRQASIFTELVGRLSPGSIAAQAEQQLRATMSALVQQYPEMNAIYREHVPTVYAGIGVPVAVRAETRSTMRLLFGTVSVLLLIACANVANLLLFRGVNRRGETAVRRALGASTARLAQQNFVEGLLLSCLGGVVGIAVAVALIAALRGQSLVGLPPIDSISIDWRVLTFTLIAALFTGIAFTLAPALATLRMRLSGSMQTIGRSGSGDGAAVRSTLTVVQVAASLALLVGALLLVRTVQNLRDIERGFDPGAVLVYGYDPSPQGYEEDAARALRTRLLNDVAALPGIRSASIATSLPVPGDAMIARITVPGSSAAPIEAANFDVSAEYFSTIGTRIIAGRPFTAADEHAVPAAGAGVILGEATARALFGDADALGRVVEILGFTGRTQQPVIGVAEDVRMGARDVVRPTVYQPLGAAALQQGYVLVRSNMTPSQTHDRIAAALARIDPDIPFFQAESLGDEFARANAEEQLLARLLTLFAGLAVALAAIGRYGVIAYSIARRQREIGIRMALGARTATVVLLVVRQSLMLLAPGIVLGTLGAFALSRSLGSRMYGITPVDPATYLVAIAGFAVVAAVASAVPARAATHVDPATTLRQE
jgi:predicted permease